MNGIYDETPHSGRVFSYGPETSQVSGIIFLCRSAALAFGRRFVLRSEFDKHPLWDTTRQIAEASAQIQDEHVLSEVQALETTLFYVAHAESFKEIATASSALFSSEMLDAVNIPFAAALNSLQVRIANGVSQTAYLSSAAVQAEASLIPMGPWPRPYGKGGQVTQMNTMFENLLETQRASVESLEGAHARLREQVTELESEVSVRQVELDTSLVLMRSEGESVIDLVNAEKARIDQVVANGLAAVSSVESSNAERYKSWQAEQDVRFRSDFDPLESEMRNRLQQADEIFEKLRNTNEQFENLSAIAAGETIANNFEREASWGRKTGIVMYSVGGLFLLAAATPLVWLLFEGGLDVAGQPQWGLITVRLAIGILAGSAATVIIRLGARLISNANASKRMELELRSIGPFLANVVDPIDVDKARIALVSRSFGQANLETKSSKQEDAVSVSVIAQVVELILKTANK